MLKKPNPRLKPDALPTPDKIKIVVVGDQKVGKTQLLNAYCNDKFDKNYEQTIGSDSFCYTGKFPNGKLC